MPTKSNLLKRKVLSDPTCHLCGNRAEDAMYALWECEAVKLVGGMDFGWVNRFEAAHGTFTELCDRIMTQPRFPEIFDNIAWFIWSYRNKTRLNKSTQPLDRIPEAVHSFLSAFQRIKVLPRSTAPSRKKRRTTPTVGEF